MSAALDIAVCDVIDTATASLTKGVNLFASPLRPEGNGIPGEACFVYSWGGPAPQVYNDGGAGKNLNLIDCQITLRWTSDSPKAGDDLAAVLYNALRKSTPTGTIAAEAQNSAPLYLGQDDKGHHVWTINLRLYESA